MGISHSWNGTVLTITSDSGTSSADLKGDVGIRGPQGPVGDQYKPQYGLDYFTEAEKDDFLAEIDEHIEANKDELFMGEVRSYVDQTTVNAEYVGEYVNNYVRENTVNAPYVESYVAANAVNEEYVKSYVGENAVNADYVTGYVADNTVNADYVTGYVADNTVNEEYVKSYVGANAAPSGYGYGGYPITINTNILNSEEELNSALEEIYSATNNGETKLIRFIGYPSGSDYNWFGFLFKSSANYGSILLQSAYTKGCLISKVRASGAWQPIEWINPPMNVGVEYRTTERWNGKPVYQTLLSVGAFTNPIVVKPPGFDNIRVIEMHGELRMTENRDNTLTVPGRMGSNEVWIDQSFAYSQQPRFKSTDGWEWPIGRPFYLRLKYWKYTD